MHADLYFCIMCTVTFLPGNNNQFILTSNRDEHSLRLKAAPPEKFNVNDLDVFYPKDGQAGGSWIAATKDFTLCLLNGAFNKHIRNPPYTKSRGIMLLDFFEFNDVTKFAGKYQFSGIEPFTLLILETVSELKLHELRWDGVALNLQQSDARVPHIWSSVTLYEPEIIELRRKWFHEWLASHQLNSMDSIMHFHEFAGGDDKTTAVLMNRNNELLTVSITSVSKLNEGMIMKYKDVEMDTLYTIRIL